MGVSPRECMYGIFTCIWLMFMVHVGVEWCRYIPYMDPMGIHSSDRPQFFRGKHSLEKQKNKNYYVSCLSTRQYLEMISPSQLPTHPSNSPQTFPALPTNHSETTTAWFFTAHPNLSAATTKGLKGTGWFPVGSEPVQPRKKNDSKAFYRNTGCWK